MWSGYYRKGPTSGPERSFQLWGYAARAPDPWILRYTVHTVCDTVRCILVTLYSAQGFREPSGQLLIVSLVKFHEWRELMILIPEQSLSIVPVYTHMLGHSNCLQGWEVEPVNVFSRTYVYYVLLLQYVCARFCVWGLLMFWSTSSSR